MSVQCFEHVKNAYQRDVFLLFMKYPCSRLEGIYVNHIAKTYEEVIRHSEERHFLQTISILK